MTPARVGSLALLALAFAARSSQPAAAQPDLEVPDPDEDAPPALPDPDEDAPPALPDPDEDAPPALPDPDEDAPPTQTPSSTQPQAEVDNEPPPTLRDRLDSLPFDVGIKAGVRVGVRTHRNLDFDRFSLGEARIGIRVEKHIAPAEITGTVAADFVDDHLADELEPNLHTGEGAIDLREATFSMTPVPWATLRLGRQIVTWGTGDLVFVNDTFAKDFQSFLIGRDDTYLKAPTDAARLDLRYLGFDATVLYAPQFDPDRAIDPTRFHVWTGASLSQPGDPVIEPITPNSPLEDDEWSARLHTVLGTTELAIYGYDGFYGSPRSQDATSLRPTHSRLRQGGLSARDRVLRGLGWAEAAFAFSVDDASGRDPLVPNSELKALIGYEIDVGAHVTVSGQLLYERMLRHGRYQASLPVGAVEFDENRIVATARVEYVLQRSELRVSGFGFFSPTDRDGHLRLRVDKALLESVHGVAGANLYFGRDDFTQFGMLVDNSNVFAAVEVSL